MELRRTFDRQALLYDKARPRYPEELFEQLVSITHIRPDDYLLEIGPGTGQATQSLAKRGFRIVGIELGEHLAAVARHTLRHYPKVEIITGTFEETELPAHKFQLIYSATAFHWIKPEVKFTKTHSLLALGGYLAIIHTNHVSDGAGDAFHHASQTIYDQYWPPEQNPHILPKTDDLAAPELDEGLFQLTHFEVFPMTVRYTADEYVDLLATYSPTLALPDEQQHAFLDSMRQLINDQFNGYHTKHFAMSLAIAQAM